MKQRRTKSIEIGFLGGGNMAEALVRGLVANGRQPASLMVSEPDAAKRRQMAKRYRVGTTADNDELVAESRVVVIAVKPQVLPAVLSALAPSPRRPELFVSIAAGVPSARIESLLGSGARVVRAMPNTPCLVGKAASVLCAGAHATASDLRTAKAIFAAVGDAHVVADEELMHLVTALSGSGPAYVYRFVEAMVAAAEQASMDPELARRLAYQTVAGAAEMLIATGQEPAELRRAVSSPGGTTLAGLEAMDAHGFADAVAAALAAAAARSRELAWM